QRVRETGDWESWIEFFLKGVEETANQATQTAGAINQLFVADRKKIADAKIATVAILSVHAYLQKHPIVSTVRLKDDLKVSLPTVLRSLAALQKIGIVKEVSGKRRGRVYSYGQYLEILSSGTEPLRR